MSVLLESSVLHRPSAADPSMEQRHNCIPAWGFLVDVILLSVHLTVTSFAGFKINSSPADLALLSFFFFFNGCQLCFGLTPMANLTSTRC